MEIDMKDIKKLAPTHTLFFNKMKDVCLKLRKRIVQKIMIVINKLKLYHIKHIYNTEFCMSPHNFVTQILHLN